MKSLAVNKNGTLEIIDIDVPRVNECNALVKVMASGICGTDMKIIHSQFKGFTDYPCLLGHEAVGEVVEIGNSVTQFKVGDKVLLPYLHGKIGEYTPIHGGFSEYGLVHDWQALARAGKGPGTDGFNDFFYTQKTIPSDFDAISSVMIITLREVMAATRHFGFQPKKSIVIFGGGPVGLAFTKFAQIMGMAPVILVDILDEKEKDAKKAGADCFINSGKRDVVQEVRRLCPEGVDFTLDAVGVNSLMNLALQLIKNCGRILVYGISPKNKVDLDWNPAPFNWNIEVFQYPMKELEADVHEQLIRWIELGLVNPADFVSHVFDSADILKGFEMIENKKPAKKVVIKY